MKKPPTFRYTAALAAVLLTTTLIGGCGGENPESLIASSKEFLAKNDNQAAIIQLKNALQQNPNLPEGRFLLGKALLESGDISGAEVELRKAQELRYAPDQTIPLLARALLSSGKTKKVIEEFGKTELTSGEPAASLKTTLSDAYQSLGEREKAKDALTAALASKLDYSPALLADARQKAVNRDLEGSLAIVDGILASSPKNHEALLFKGALASMQGDKAKSLELYRKSVEAKPGFLVGHSAIIVELLQRNQIDDAVKQLEALKKVSPKHPQTVYLDALISYQRKDYKTARTLAQQLLKYSPNVANSLQIAGAIEYQLRSYIQAEAYLAKALQQSSDLPLARRFLISTYLRTGQAGKALSTLTPVLGKIDKDADFLSLAGETFLQNGDAKKAEFYFSKASQLDPNNPEKRTSLALSHMAIGDQATSFSELEQISASDKGTAADLALISAHLRRNDLDKALKAIDILDKKQPDNPATNNLRARTLLAKKDVKGARKEFEKALSINPAFLPAAASLAAMDIEDKKPEDAQQRFEKVLAVEPSNLGALLALANLKSASGSNADSVLPLINKAIEGNPTETTPRLALIEFHLRNKDTKKALAAAQSAASTIPDKPQLLDALGRVQQISGDSNQALATYSKLAGLQPASPFANLRMAEIHQANNNKDEAVKNLRKALEIKPDLAEAQRGLIALAMDDKKPLEALAIARKMQTQRPKDVAGYMFEGDIHASGKRWAEALAAYRAGLKQTPDPALAIKTHDALVASGSAADAEKLATTWTREHPKDSSFRMHLGDIATAKKDYPAAIQNYRAALEIQPNNALVLNNLAWVLGQTKSPKAMEYAEKALLLSPDQPPFMDTQAMLLADRGETEKAIVILKKALTISPQAAAIQLNLAKLLIGAGRKDEARTELDALTKLGSRFPNQAEVLRLQKEL